MKTLPRAALQLPVNRFNSFAAVVPLSASATATPFPSTSLFRAPTLVKYHRRSDPLGAFRLYYHGVLLEAPTQCAPADVPQGRGSLPIEYRR